MSANTTIQATWIKITSAQQLQRSSHNLNVINDKAVYIFGGELKPREPRDNDIHKIDVSNDGNNSSTIQTISFTPGGPSPSPRVGSSSTVIENTIYFFSGRGGIAMAPIDEDGGIWSFDTIANTWTLISPSSPTSPEARSYHCMTSDGKDILYIHAGCPEKGRLNDLWSFSLATKGWKQLASAPGTPRGGTSIAFSEGKIWRLGGFDGEKEIGGILDSYDPETDSWNSVEFVADGIEGPGARSVAALVPVGERLVTLFGESDPSSLGHQGAGKMLEDVWGYDLKKGKWERVENEAAGPEGRGWFDADVVSVDGNQGIVVGGGLGESNERLSDLWVLTF